MGLFIVSPSVLKAQILAVYQAHFFFSLFPVVLSHSWVNMGISLKSLQACFLLHKNVMLVSTFEDECKSATRCVQISNPQHMPTGIITVELIFPPMACMCMSMHVSMCVGTRCLCMWKPAVDVFVNLIYWDKVFHLNLELADWLVQLSSLPLVLYLHYLIGSGVLGRPPCWPSIFVDDEDLNLGSHPCTVSTLLSHA